MSETREDDVDELGPAGDLAWGWERGEDGKWRERPIPEGDPAVRETVRQLRLAVGGVRHHRPDSEYGERYLRQMVRHGLELRGMVADLERRIATRGGQLLKATEAHPRYREKEDEMLGWTVLAGEARRLLRIAAASFPAGMPPGFLPSQWEDVGPGRLAEAEPAAARGMTPRERAMARAAAERRAMGGGAT